MYYLPGQKKEFRWSRFRYWITGLLIGFLIGIFAGYWWCYKVNMNELEVKLFKQRQLNEELKKGYAPPRMQKGEK
jgi:hypothetical protein